MTRNSSKMLKHVRIMYQKIFSDTKNMQRLYRPIFPCRKNANEILPVITSECLSAPEKREVHQYEIFLNILFMLSISIVFLFVTVLIFLVLICMLIFSALCLTTIICKRSQRVTFVGSFTCGIFSLWDHLPLRTFAFEIICL